jgi:hypothetical protein
MRVSVVQAGKGVLHVGGDLDTYSLETLRDYVTRFLQKSLDAHVLISMAPEDEDAFRKSATRWIESLEAAGASVSVSVANARAGTPALGRVGSAGRNPRVAGTSADR